MRDISSLSGHDNGLKRLEAVAIDGPAGAGKSTVARAVAEQLGYLYVDTGAMYRAVAFAAQRRGIDLENMEAMAEIAAHCHISFAQGGERIILDGEDVSAAIRTPEITAITRFAAHAPGVRQRLVARQREMARERPAVMEGRDICTVVLPQARWKFFLTASAEERARRRQREMAAAGYDVPFERILADIRSRDLSDMAVGPLRQARELALSGSGEIALIDTTDLAAEEVVAAMLRAMCADARKQA